MSVTELRPRAAETFVCPCGSQWFVRKYQFDTQGHLMDKEGHFECAGGCGRKHLPGAAELAPVRALRS